MEPLTEELGAIGASQSNTSWGVHPGRNDEIW